MLLASLLLLPLFSVSAYAQLDAATMAKRQARKNLVIREWNTDAKTQTKWLDRITTYDDQGRKIEEIEYTRKTSRAPSGNTNTTRTGPRRSNTTMPLTASCRP